jgi:hypothetical protein
MRKLWFLLPLVFSLSSCFDVIEDISLKANGSGSFLYIVNCSQSKSEIASMLKLDSFMGSRLPSLSEIQQNVSVTRKALSASEGISNVTVTEDYTNYIIEIRGNFASIKDFNNAVKKISIGMGAEETIVNEGFNYEGSDTSFARIVSAVLDDKAAKKVEKLLGANLAKASYTMIIHSEKPIQKVSNSVAKLSPSKKAVMLKMDAGTVIKYPEKLNLFIDY